MLPVLALADGQTSAGGVGLLQNPTARFAPDGSLTAGLSVSSPYNHLYLSLQFLPWLETTLRYTEDEQRLFGPASFSGKQTAKDRGLDFKVRLLAESVYIPELALGVRDIGGTGLFAAEYLVGNKAFGPVDISLGIGWGRLGSRGDFDNPLGSLSDRFDTRPTGISGEGGRVDVKRWFRGEEVAVFGGIEWHTPLRGLSVLLEYEGNDYETEPSGTALEVDAPVNFGLRYQVNRAFGFTAGVERGNTAVFTATLGGNFQRDESPPKKDPLPPTIRPVQNPQQALAAIDLAALAERLRAQLSGQEASLHALDLDQRRLTLWFSQKPYRNPARAVGRVARAAAAVAPDGVMDFTLVNVEAGQETYRVDITRADLEQALTYVADSTRAIWPKTVIRGPGAGYDDADLPELIDYPTYSWGIAPALRQQIGGPDSFYIGQLWLRFSGDVQLTDRLGLSAVLGANLVDNLDDLDQVSDSRLPRVRSDIARYRREGKNNLVRLESNYIWSPAPQWYSRLSAGIFEEMYGGVAGELLYRPYGAQWAAGLEVNRVRQRDFDQRFDFLDYEVTTGHLTGYFELPWWNLLAKLSVGQYLAGDQGTTIDLSRRFASGARVGAFASFTDVSAEDFGEGSFDKGFYMNLPLDLFFPKSTRSTATISFRPLTRDGGQKVRAGRELYPLTVGSEPGEIVKGWNEVLD
ncbi:MAG: YjbH domain-containing protein [Nevskiales bacterium]